MGHIMREKELMIILKGTAKGRGRKRLEMIDNFKRKCYTRTKDFWRQQWHTRLDNKQNRTSCNDNDHDELNYKLFFLIIILIINYYRDLW